MKPSQNSHCGISSSCSRMASSAWSRASKSSGPSGCVVGRGGGGVSGGGCHGVARAALYDAARLWETRHFNTDDFAVSGALHRLCAVRGRPGRQPGGGPDCAAPVGGMDRAGGLRGAHRHRRARPAAGPPRDPAQLPGDRPPALPARVHPARDPAVLHRERRRGRALLARAALAGLPARQGRARQAAVRHPARRHASPATSGSTTRCGRRSSPTTTSASSSAAPTGLAGGSLHPAVQRQRVQHLGDELRRAVGQRDPGAQPGRQARRLRARHRRGLDLRAPPRARRRPDLGDRLAATSAAATTTAASATSASPPTRATRRSR